MTDDMMNLRDGFPRHRAKADSLSAVVNEALGEKGMLPSDDRRGREDRRVPGYRERTVRLSEAGDARESQTHWCCELDEAAGQRAGTVR